MLYSSGISFVSQPSLFSHLQDMDDDSLVSISVRLMKVFRSPFAVLATCDRAEIISEERVSLEPFERLLSLSPAAMRPYRYSYECDEALIRLFRLSTGILSPLFGEDTIISQIGRALHIGRLSGTLSPELSKLLNMASAFGKRVQSGMKVRVFDSAIADEMSSRLSGCGDILIVGSGEGARMLAEALCRSHAVFMTLRDMDKTFLVPPGVKAVPYEERRRYAASSDAVISVTSGLYHTFEESDSNLLSGKLLFDFSSPQDIPSGLGAVRVEDLGIELPERQKVIDSIAALSLAEASEYRSWLEREKASPSINEKAESIAYDAIRRLSGPLSRIGGEEGKAFRESVFDSVRKAVVSYEMDIRRS